MGPQHDRALSQFSHRKCRRTRMSNLRLEMTPHSEGAFTARLKGVLRLSSIPGSVSPNASDLCYVAASLDESYFKCTIEMVGLSDAAEHFQRAGLTALISDPRGMGLSNGQPRNEIDILSNRLKTTQTPQYSSAAYRISIRVR